MDPKFAVAGRALGEVLPISVSTAVAIELLSEKKEHWVPELWINVRTAFRNFYSVIANDDKKYVGPEHIYPALLNELELIRESVKTITQGSTKVVYYYCDYSDLARHLPHAVVREATTENQKRYNSIEWNLFQVLLKEATQFEIREFKTAITGSPVSCLMMTHYPVDLLWAKSFGKLRLLESHTGAVKSKSEWNTKLTNGKQLTQIPFNYFTLQIFGDNNNLISAMSPKIKSVVVDLAEKHRWTTVTTMDRIRFSVSEMKDPFARDWLMKVLKA